MQVVLITLCSFSVNESADTAQIIQRFSPMLSTERRNPGALLGSEGTCASSIESELISRPAKCFANTDSQETGDPWCSPQSAPSPHTVADAAARVAEPVRHSPLSSIAANQTIRPARRSVTRWVAPRGGPEGRADIRSRDRRLAGNRASGARRQPRRCSASRFGDKVGARADFWGRLTASSQFRGEERESIGSKTRCTTANGCTAPRYCQSASQSHGSLGRHSSQQVRWQ